MVAAAVLLGWLTLAALHIKDEYRITHLQGVWIAAAGEARGGHLYSPLFDGERYAGTRWMPLPILANALAAAVIGDPLIGGKALAILLMAALLSLCVAVLRQFRCPWSVSFGLAAAIVATETGLQAACSIGGDVLPVLLQVGAIALVLRRHDMPAAAAAGLLAGLAAASKLTGMWGILAIVTWLLARGQKRAAAVTALAMAVTAAVVLGSVQLITGGGLLQHLLAFSLAGVSGAMAITRSPNQLLFNLRGNASATIVLLPFAALGPLLCRGWRQLSLVHLALGLATVLTLVVYMDAGTGANQLLDIIVLTSLAAGHLTVVQSGERERPHPRTVLTLAVAVAVIWAAGLDLVRTVGFDLRRSVAAIRAGEAPPRATARIAALVAPSRELLTEDPAVDVALGRRPRILDPYMLTRLDRIHPEWVDPLLTQIAERRFDAVVLLVALEDRRLDYWWDDYHFGPRIAHALRTSYRLEQQVGRYYLYRPQPLTAGQSDVPKL